MSTFRLLREIEALKAENALLLRQLSNQTRHNIASRRSLCEQSDRYKAERDAALAELAAI